MLGPVPSFEAPGVIKPEVIPEEAGVAQRVSALCFVNGNEDLR